MDYNREIAILLATYNGEKYIELQLQSLIDQTFDDFICYVHDDNSTDKTVEIIKKFETKYPDKIKLLNYEKGHGAIGNLFGKIPRNHIFSFAIRTIIGVQQSWKSKLKY